MMRIAIIGRTEILFETAKQLRNQGHEIAVIITAKEAPEYTKSSDDFKRLAEEWNIPFISTSKIIEAIEFISSCKKIDIGISLNYSGLIPSAVIDLFPLGILNAHGGDLPRYRGNACQAWAIINGEDKIGLCIHKMIGGELDSGDILARNYLSIDPNTRIGQCYDWMNNSIPRLFLESLQNLASNKEYVLETQSRKPQDAIRCYPRQPSDGKIDWNKPGIEILRLINASSEPFSGAFCEYNGEKVTIWRADLYEDSENYLAVPGQVAMVDKKVKKVVVITGKGKLKLQEIEFKGNRCHPTELITGIRKRLK
jgi:methionyl-tRNA formyltransferase